ncbi:hypothetical protein J8J14_13720 [Roseomonas sp. SSH11]|uniref:Uncharacterized protein n=1 Tax=Pararoseomonas baculiformis TaxID=2820812 RepID=A0ABS4AFQ9_9PROT|nr:hypothetical protein [Pararoseomonas baculiformis]MBP0445833.1 hypothetical protein [Pararoseomonas baculiformis]
MTLLDDLRGLDLSGIMAARASITVSLEGPAVSGLVEHGPLGALGEVGDQLRELRALSEDPAALLGPLLGAVGGLAGTLRPADVPVEPYIRAVKEGAEAVSGLLRDVDGTPASWLRALKLPVGEALTSLLRGADEFDHVALADTGRFTHALALTAAGLPRQPAALVEQGLGMMLPFGDADLGALRRLLDGTLPALGSIALPAGRMAGLMTAIGEVRDAATGPDAGPAVTAALGRLAEARKATLGQLRQDLLSLQARLSALRLPQAVAPITAAAGAFRTGESGFREMMEELRGLIRSTRSEIDALDAARVEELVALFEGMLDTLEADAKAAVEERVDALADELVAYVRSFLGHLHLAEMRGALHARFETYARAVRDADLDRFAREARERLAGLGGLISADDLGERLRAPLQAIAATIREVVNSVAEALQAIAAAVSSLVAQARGLLEQAAALLRGFKATLDEVVAAIDGMDIEGATQSILDRLSGLRRKAQDLLSGVELPEPLRPVVEQLVAELRALDLDALLLEPVRREAERLTLSDALRGRLSALLDEVSRALDNLVPASLVQGIEAELARATEAFAALSSARLVAALKRLLDELADAVAKLDPVPALEGLRAPFRGLLGAVDAVKPSTLLRPVLDAYDEAFARLVLPDPTAAGTATEGFLAQGAEQLGQGLTAPLGPTLGATPGTAAPSSSPPPPAERRPGDFVRLLGTLPRRLKETVASLEAGPLGEAEAAFARLTTGLVRDLRGIEGVIWQIEDRVQDGLDTLLRPLSSAGLEAGFAVQARLQLGPLELDATADALAAASPDALRLELQGAMAPLRDEIRRTVAAVGDASAAAEAIAGRLQAALPQAGGGLAGFLDQLDPEPLAVEVDELVATALERLPPLALPLRGRIAALPLRVTGFVRDYGPAMLALRFRRVLDAVREELDGLNPHHLAADLDLVHAALREALATYDPAVIATGLREAVLDLSATLRGIDVAATLGELDFLDEAVAGLSAASPAAALEGVGEELEEIGATLTELDPRAMLEAVDRLGPRVVGEFGRAVEAVRAEIATLLEALHFAAAGGTASVSVRVEAG